MSNRFHNNPPLRYGMIGGGITSQIGDSHRAALRRDSYFQLVAGAFDVDKKRAGASALQHHCLHRWIVSRQTPRQNYAY